MSGKRKRRPVGQTIGGIIVGLDYQIFRTGKPPAEMVESAKPIRPVAAEGGGTIEVELPVPGEVSHDKALQPDAPRSSGAEDDPAT
jgi:hypothetical protein